MLIPDFGPGFLDQVISPARNTSLHCLIYILSLRDSCSSLTNSFLWVGDTPVPSTGCSIILSDQKLLSHTMLLLFSHAQLFVGMQHAMLLCPLSPGVHSNLCPLSQWFYLTISVSATSFSFCISFSIRDFSNELALHIRWSKYWSFSFSINPSNAYSGFSSFRID